VQNKILFEVFNHKKVTFLSLKISLEIVNTTGSIVVPIITNLILPYLTIEKGE
jgi:hypothetical protein